MDNITKSAWQGPTPSKCQTLTTREGWIWLMEDYGHVWFYLDGKYYFLFPEGPHKYGLCYGEDEVTGNFPRWEFNSEIEFLEAPLFSGKCMLERLDDVLDWEP